MRTTITFDDDVAAAVTRLRREASRGVSEIVNDLIRAGLSGHGERRPFVQQTEDIGIPSTSRTSVKRSTFSTGPTVADAGRREPSPVRR